MIWLWWIVLALVLGIVEMLSLDLVFLMLAGGALAGGLTSFITPELWIQVVVASVAATALLFLARPAAKRWMLAHSPNKRMNVSALVGRHATVVAEVTAAGGRVKLGGEVWSARSSSRGDVFPEGADVVVVRIDGAFAVVGRDVATPAPGPGTPGSYGTQAPGGYGQPQPGYGQVPPSGATPPSYPQQ